MKLFGFKQAQKNGQATEQEKRYTRFPHTHCRSRVQTAEDPTKQSDQRVRITPKHPVVRQPRENPQPPSLADQLYSEATISTALLRRALPSRFAEIDARTREMAKKDLAELQAQARWFSR